MAQILVRGIADDVMRAFKERARRHGRSQEQGARLLIEEAALESEGWERFEKFSARMLRELRRGGEAYGDSTREIRADRDSR